MFKRRRKERCMNSKSMQAAVFMGMNKIEIQSRPIPQVVDGSLLVRVRACAICGSDLRIAQYGNERVQPPRILGHEISGEVEAVGRGVSSFSVGDRIAVGADIPCGECSHCLGGRANCCDTNLAIGYQYDGGFADYLLLDPLIVKWGPIAKFSPRISFEAAALAEPLGCCLNGYERALMAPGRSVVIFGAGPIGLMLAMLAPKLGARSVTLIDPEESRLAAAVAICGADGVNPTKTDPVQAIMERTKGQGADMIFTACTAVETHEQAVQMVAKRGVVNLFGGLKKTERPISISSNVLHYREAYLMGSHGSTPDQHRRALAMIENGDVPLQKLVSRTYPLASFQEAFDCASSRQIHKVVLTPSHGN